MTEPLCVMIQKQLHTLMICKKIILLLSAFFLTCLSVYSIEKASVKYEENLIDYSVLDSQKILKEADSFFNNYEQTGDKKYLSTAMGKYYILTKIFPVDMYPTVQLARTYDAANVDRLAKEYFNIGYDINKRDPYLNFYNGEFYFKRNDYKRALRYYKIAYNNGYSDYYDLNLKIATIYEKFADLINAKYYYERAYSMNPSASYLKDKAIQIQSLNYDKSEYYNSIRK